MRLQSLCVALALITIPVTAAADPKAQAKDHMAKAAEAHKAGRFADARTELNATYALDPQPQLLYALGQVYVKLGQCGEAIMFYEQFIDSNPAAAAAESAQQAINACKVAAAQQQAAQPQEPLEDLDRDEAPPNLTTAPPVTAQPAQVDGPRPAYKDPIQLALVGGGAVSLVAGLVFYSSARGLLDDAEAAATYEASSQLVDDAKGKRMLSVVFTVAGAGLVAGGIYYYLRTHRSSERSTVTVIPTTEGGLVTWSGRF